MPIAILILIPVLATCMCVCTSIRLKARAMNDLRSMPYRTANLRGKIQKCVDEIRIICRMIYEAISARIWRNINVL